MNPISVVESNASLAGITAASACHTSDACQKIPTLGKQHSNGRVVQQSQAAARARR